MNTEFQRYIYLFLFIYLFIYVILMLYSVILNQPENQYDVYVMFL
jgi:hypothetical protein